MTTLRPANTEVFPFSEVTTLTPGEQGRFVAEINPEWSIASKPNGGYLLAALGRAAVSVSSHSHVVAASAHYVRSPEPGPATIEAEVLRSGRSASQVRARMTQDGQLCVEALVTTGQLDASGHAYWDRGLPEPAPVPFEECTRLPSTTPDGRRVAILDQVDLRLEPRSRGFISGQPSGRGELRGWLILPAGEDFDPASLVFAVDAFPPATFDIEFSGWVPTFELTVYIRALPAPGPVWVLQRANLIDGQRVDESCFVWDVTGRLVAQASQLAGVRLG